MTLIMLQILEVFQLIKSAGFDRYHAEACERSVINDPR